ncbi:MAG: methyl-accepting chemotaxis protein [Myxococcota bacterium]
MAAPRSNKVWHILFRPALAVLNRLRYAPKFILVGIVLLVPFAFTAYLQYSGASDSVAFSRKETIGVDYITKVDDFLWAVQRHRMLSVAVLAGEGSYRQAEAQARLKANAAMAEVDKVDALYGETLKTTASWQQVKAAWARTSDEKFASAAASEQAHAELAGLVISLILNDAGNNSNLILDPDLDSYWLMDFYVVKAGALGDLVSHMATTAVGGGGEVGVLNDRAIELAGVYQAVGGITRDMVNVNFKTSFQETKNAELKPTLERPLSDAVSESTSFVELTKRGYLTAGATAPAIAGTVDAALRALERVAGLASATGPSLRQLCEVRADGYAASRSQGLVAAVVAALLLIYLFFALYLSVDTSVSALGVYTKRMIEGTNERFAATTKDELGKVTEDYNDINTALVDARALRDQVQNDNQLLQADIFELLQVVSDASEGNLTVRAKVQAGALGNVADAFNQLMESLQTLIREVLAQVDKTTEGVTGISGSAQRMASGATSQTLEVVTATQQVDTMSNSIGSVAKDANEAAGAARRAEQAALQGSEAVQRVIAGMESLRSNVQAGAKKMKSLGDRSMEITGIVGTIARISEQTNMLALNAAIEAARAGEHGRGFTVVAEEVRKLAERTAAATQDIDKLVKAIQVETSETVHAIEQQTQIVEQESQTVSNAGDSLQRIRSVSTESAALVGGISTTASKQVEATRAVLRTMEQISQIAMQTQQGAEVTVTTVDSLIALSNQLSESVRRFKIA